ncbi:ABC transporter ATP-binding protein [Microvirga thermotolerans]|uniref:ATP-binding cassette domain-containing protein n=1 Tax=Microvirga thermotolerans TaxID=2651334 RepID=A0A5P9JWK5_9HYPH|nr:ABC transporter ATP-binding protein [Microvirga thermotolerans]QFU15585.1 ATP-binding cassette domain-containing protein [Microvirga thermotolerans]
MNRQKQRGDATRDVLRFTFRHWRREPKYVFLVVATMMTATLADVFMPLFAGRLVDAISLGAGDREAALSGALTAFVAMTALGLAMVIMRHLAFYGIVELTLRVMSRVAQDAFARVQRFSTDWHANSFAGSVVRKITRGMWALDLLHDTILLALLPSLVVLIGSMIVLGTHWPVMGLVIAVGTAAYIAMTALLSVLYVAPAARLANAWDTKVGGTLADALSCNAVVKAFGAEMREDARLRGVLAKWQSRTRRVWQRGTNSGTTQLVALLAIRAAIIGTALWLWWEDRASPGDLAYVLTTYFVIHGYLRDVGMHINNLRRSVNDMEELVSIHGEPVGIEDRPSAPAIHIARGEIAFDHVSFHYAGHETPLYRDLSLTIRAGERVGLVGPSGSGKTTLVKLVQRLYDVSGGRILIDGQNIAGVQQASLRSQIAIVQQEPVLFHRTLAENIAYVRPGASMAEIERAARLANAHAFIGRLPKGYGTLVGERGVKLSGGERQRVAIARAFLANAPILILDEATSALDSESETLIQQAMERLMEGRTSIVIAHRLSTVRALDRILVFDRGRIVEEGTHAALYRKNGLYRRLCDHQGLEFDIRQRPQGQAAE